MIIFESDFCRQELRRATEDEGYHSMLRAALAQLCRLSDFYEFLAVVWIKSRVEVPLHFEIWHAESHLVALLDRIRRGGWVAFLDLEIATTRLRDLYVRATLPHRFAWLLDTQHRRTS